MRILLIAALSTFLGLPAVAGERSTSDKIGVQSVRATGERVGVQSTTGTNEPVGVQIETGTNDAFGLQTFEEHRDAELGVALWDLGLVFARGSVFVDTDTWKTLRAVADLLRVEDESRSRVNVPVVYVQGLSERAEAGVLDGEIWRHRAEIAASYLELFGVDGLRLEIVLPGSVAETRMAEQAKKHRARREAAAKASGQKLPPLPTRGVRFGIVEQ